MKKRFGLILLGIIGLTLSGCGVSGGIYPDGDKYLAGNQTYNENLTSLDVDWISGNLTLIEDENIEGVKIEEDTDLTKESQWVHSYLNDGVLKIKFFASGYRLNTPLTFKKDLTITYKPTLKNIKIELTSGKCTASKLSAEKCIIDITSGTALVDTIEADNIVIDQTSGRIEINHISAQELVSDMTSGTLKVGFSEIEKATFDMTSGSLNMTLPEDGGKVKVSKTSGSITTNRECTVKSGLYTFGNGDADIKVSMTSGSVVIN